MTTTSHHWPHLNGIVYGGDYNPEQWPRETWQEDVVLMREAGVNLVSVGVFSWALLESEDGAFDFSWLDDVLDLLHSNGIFVALGTPTAAPPAWFFARHPDTRIVNREGIVLGTGSRGMASHSAPAYRAAAVRIADALARRYGNHPALALWHVHNEYGAPVREDHSDHAARAWRGWLRRKYQSLSALNTAWGTAFWGQYYEDWEHIATPALAPSVVNPSQQLDFARFSDAQLRECYIAERDAIRRHSDLPITTNFMANQYHGCDLWAWAREVDVVADDHYLVGEDDRSELGLAIAADLTRSLAGGRPWMLMEHSTSAVNWQERNLAKRPLEMARNALTHLGRGADAIMFFQWRASRHGAEKFHSAMVPHAGTRSRVWREVLELGSRLSRLSEVQGSRVRADVAILWDYESFWAQDLEWRPSVDLSHNERVRAYYDQLWRAGITTDFALPGADLSAYKLVIAPAQYLLRQADADNLTRYVADGGILVVSYFSAVVDENDAVHPGGFLAPLSEVLGVQVEEHLPQSAGVRSAISLAGRNFTIDLWQEDLRVLGAEVKGKYVGGAVDGQAAVTRNLYGAGVGWYVSTRPNAEGLTQIMTEVCADAGVSVVPLPHGLELVRRHGDQSDYLVAINHGARQATLKVDGVELLTDQPTHGDVTVPAGGVAVVRTRRSAR